MAIFLAAVFLTAQPDVYVLRHGETTWNVEKRIQGQSNASKLTPKGEGQVVDVMQRLSPPLENKRVEIWSSDLSRAHDTAKIIAKALGLGEEDIQLDASLREANFGHFEGKEEEYYRDHPDFLHFKEDQFHHAMDPLHGESYKAVAVRVQGAISRILSDSKAEAIIIVTHGGAIRSLQMASSIDGDYNAVKNPRHDEIYIFDHHGKLIQQNASSCSQSNE